MPLKARGYKASESNPLFLRGAEAEQKRALQRQLPTPTPATDTTTDGKPIIFFHVQYHPDGTTSCVIERIWRETLSTPEQCRTLASHPSHDGPPIGLECMIVCYNIPHNMGNILPYRKMNTGTCPPVSSYRITNSVGPEERERAREDEQF
jgi:hypothetical protein